MMMKNTQAAGLPELIHDIATQTGCTVLLATDTGSRGRGLSSDSSDFDVRMVYLPPIEWYYSVNRKVDRDTFTSDELRGRHKVTAPKTIDIVGFELSKFLGMVRASNITALDILASPVVYHWTGWGEAMRQLLNYDHAFNLRAVAHQHLGAARSKVYDCALLERPATVKEWLSFLTSALRFRFLERYGKAVTPMSFDALLSIYSHKAAFMQAALDLVEMKRAGYGSDLAFPEDLVAWATEFMNSADTNVIDVLANQYRLETEASPALSAAIDRITRLIAQGKATVP